ncbi:MAG: tRNA uridine-5-carboxymethylaminomethyl(34) synthesis GTPase MnmE, partial [Planctomycetota bacterium]
MTGGIRGADRSGTTIAAIASPPGGAARGIVRLSGPRAAEIVRAVFRGHPPLDLARRTLRLGRFLDGRGDQPLLLLWMPGPRSFTREDVAEFHLCGSPPLLEAALEHVLALGATAAAPGEFTRRAFLSGRIDLTRAEGVLALVGARNDRERRAGALLLAGGLAQRIGAVRDRLADLRALTEASLDFDERDTGHVPDSEIDAGLGAGGGG